MVKISWFGLCLERPRKTWVRGVGDVPRAVRVTKERETYMSGCQWCLAAVCGAVVGAASVSLVIADPTTKKMEDKLKQAEQAAKDAAKKGEQAAKDAMGAMDPDMQKQMEAWMKAGTPGAEHKALAAMAGSWNAAVQMWMGPEATKSTGTMTCEPIFDGRYYKTTYSGEMMGQTFNGHALTGYNNITKQYEQVWCDSMSTAILFSTGVRDAAGKVYTYTGTHTCPDTGKPCKMRDVFTMVGPDQMKMESYMTQAGEPESKCMEILYTRKK